MPPPGVWNRIHTTLNLAALSGLKQKIDPTYFASFSSETLEDRMSDIVVGIHRYIAHDNLKNLEGYLKEHFQASFNDREYVHSPDKLQYVLDALIKLSKPPAPPPPRAPRGTGGTRTQGNVLLQAIVEAVEREHERAVVRAPRAPRGLINPQHGVGASPVALRTRGAEQRRLQTTQRGRVPKGPKGQRRGRK
jgi:hypothetical protein